MIYDENQVLSFRVRTRAPPVRVSTSFEDVFRLHPIVLSFATIRFGGTKSREGERRDSPKLFGKFDEAKKKKKTKK